MPQLFDARPSAFAIAPDGTRIAYQVAGEGPPLLLLSGQSNSHRWWDPVRAGFEGAHRTITMDHRGTGASDKPDRLYRTEEMADDALAVLDAVGVERAHVYGTSMGGRIAQWLAARHRERVRGLVLGCTSPGGRHAVKRGDDVGASLGAADPRAALNALLSLMYTPEWLASHRGPFTTVGDPGMPPFARRRHLAASNRHDAWDVLPSIAAPTLVVHGTDDLLNPTANAPLLAGRIPGARLELIPGARHAYFEEFADVATPLVLDFLAGVPGDR
ncbi:alpha/beta fold hydrolase [Streptomyces sp. PT12]|uniref:alpha/beta fold hydrolase n=1 Tax=Streptomyces sp. PT12 TaxID=1510197 RepID=UPI000DE29CDC|nr:alpha/beta fold hydrolase [Streptomyces sp. PT12]RBM10759.1 alpha/beta hydrolase [Streptomyces sp. PT12]